MTTPIPDEVLKAWNTDGLTIEVDINTVGNLARDRANLARELLQAREGIRGLLKVCAFWESPSRHMLAGEATARACLPESQ